MRAAVALLIAACGHAAPTPAAPKPAPEPAGGVGYCAPLGYDALGLEMHAEDDGPALVTAMDSAQTAALADVDAATTADSAGRPLDAAHSFLACAKRMAAVPDGDPMVASAIGDAHVCYTDAIDAFANAGRFAAEGKAALEQAAAADPRNAAFIREQLAKPPYECPPSARMPESEGDESIAPVTVTCAEYGMMMHKIYLHGGSATPADDAITIALGDFDRADLAVKTGKHRDAALHYLDCAHRLVAIQVHDPREDEAIEVAQACYYNAIYAFANANDLARDGKAALAAAADGDPRNAAYVRGLLADAPTECAP